MATQNVIDVDALDRQHVDVRNVAGGGCETGVQLGAVDDQRVGEPETREAADQGINVYDILRRQKLVLTKAAVDALEARFK